MCCALNCPVERMVRDLGIKMLPTADNACVGSSLRHLNVIGVGLSKTGTTAAALALSRAGLKVAHNLNDLLSDHCEAIFNTLEANFELLDRKHPRARWLVTHSGDSRKWLASVQQHQQQDTIMRQSTSGFLSCRYFGCSKGMPNDKHQNATLWSRSHIRINTSTARVLPQDEARLIDAYELYYKRLFAFLRGRDYAYVDVRRGIYVGLQALHPNVSIEVPFASANQALGGGTWIGLRWRQREGDVIGVTDVSQIQRWSTTAWIGRRRNRNLTLHRRRRLRNLKLHRGANAAGRAVRNAVYVY